MIRAACSFVQVGANLARHSRGRRSRVGLRCAPGATPLANRRRASSRRWRASANVMLGYTPRARRFSCPRNGTSGATTCHRRGQRPDRTDRSRHRRSVCTASAWRRRRALRQALCCGLLRRLGASPSRVAVDAPVCAPNSAAVSECRRMPADKAMEARAGIEPTYTALQAAA